MIHIPPPPTNFNHEILPAGLNADLPADFDPSRLPIIARHWFGIEPFRSVGELAAEIVCDIKFRRRIERLHAMGPRLFAEMLAELAASHSLGTEIDRSLDRYLALDDTALDIANGHELPPIPLHEVSP